MVSERFIEILNHISPYVIVTGSYAYGCQTFESDIDFYVKEKSDEERQLQSDSLGIDWSDTDETYVNDLIIYFEEMGCTWDSCFVESFSVDDLDIPLEFSSFYSIDGNLFEIEIFGVKFLASKSNHTSSKYINGQKRSHIYV